MAIKLLIGGSPCTFWSIAQKNNRETEASGMGWELFKNYLIAKEKFKPDFFLYENNKSAAQAIKDQISHELGVDLMYINSALVSAQNRQRFYAFNWEVEQPEDRGIIIRDILETDEDMTSKEKSYRLAATEPICLNSKSGRGGVPGLQPSLQDRIYSIDGKHTACTTAFMPKIAEPVRIGTIENNAKNKAHDSKQYRVYSPEGKSTTLCGQGGGVGAKTGLYAVPFEKTIEDNVLSDEYFHGGFDGALIGMVETPMTARNGKQPSQHCRVYSCDDKSVCLGQDSRNRIIAPYDGKTTPVYEVKDGLITIKGKQYPIKLADGFYIIRKLTVTECCRLQTLPDDYCRAVSNAQAYKGLGNGWTADVIIHILNGALKDVPRDEEIIVLSMYDGIGTGRYCLDKMGFTNVKYYAYEIDKYAKQIAMSNYPDIIQCGDAFDLRNPDWTIGY